MKYWYKWKKWPIKNLLQILKPGSVAFNKKVFELL